MLKGFKQSRTDTADTGSFVTMMAILLLLATAARLLTIDVERWRSAQALSQRANTIHAIGSLTGITAGHTRWTVPAGANDDVLLFPVAAATATADIAFWRAVASATQRDGHVVQFVGVCDSGDRCAVPQGSPAITTLSYMDPYQMHNAAIARRQGRALLYRGRRLSTALVVGTDPRTTAAAIARELEKGAGG